MAIDFNTPWSWVKSSTCASTTRTGDIMKQNQCAVQNYSKIFECSKSNNCSEKNKCAQLIYTYEGLVMQGKFVESRLRFKDLGKGDKGLRKFKFIQAHYLSGLENFQADGSLGFGQSYSESDVELDDSQDIDDYSFEEGISILEASKLEYDEVDQNIFSIFMSETTLNEVQRVLILGEPDLNKIHDQQQNPLMYVPLLSQNPDDYFLWKIDINSIKFQSNTNSFEEKLEDFEQEAIISLSTTALVLPKDQIKDIIDYFQSLYQIECKISSQDLNFLVCYDLESEILLQNLNITILLGKQGQVPVYVNPELLIQKCRKQKGKYSCLLNIQLSYDGATILGESVLANSYLVFDLDQRQIGFAPAKSVYNENLLQVLIQKLEDAARQVEYDIEFIIRFSVVILLIFMALISFRNIDKIAAKIQSFLNKKKFSNNQNNAHSGKKIFSDVNFSSFQEADWQVENAHSSNNLNSSNIEFNNKQQHFKQIEEIENPDVL